MAQMLAPDHDRLDSFLQKLLGDLGGAGAASLAVLGDRLGFYAAMQDGAPVTPAELAARTHTNERNVREWLSAQAAAGYVEYDETTGRFFLTPEQAACFADEGSATFFIGAFEIAQAMFMDEPKVADAFRGAGGLGWHEHANCLFRGTERFFRSGYTAQLVSGWLPALDGAVEKLEMGALVADVGCGAGASTLLMARAFPNSRFIGFDYHEASIVRARRAAEDAGVSGNIAFEVAGAQDYPDRQYDLVCMFDCLHDMGDPVGAARYVRSTLNPGGTWMIVEPAAGDCLKDNLNPVGQLYYQASTMICTPGALSQGGPIALGAQAGEEALRRVAREAGFPRFRKVAATPFNFVFEARA